VAVLLAAVAGVRAQAPSTHPETDLDALMARALQRRDVDRKVLSDYVLDETESVDVLGPGEVPLHRSRRDFTWYVRDGIHVRSPLKFDGIPIAEADRRKYEADWMRQEEERRKRRAEREAKRGAAGKAPGLGGPPNEPRFVSEAYFMDFKFEPGNYYLAGRDTIDGHDVLKIDYYPTHLFDDDDEGAEAGGKPATQDKDAQEEARIERQMNKTALVTLWVDPASAQIVKYTFENVWMDFLPAGWLVRIDDLHASMEMEQPFPGVWLPRGIAVHAGVTTAPGSFSVAYRRDYRNYRRADVTSRVRVPKGGR
jgi:hypothetical protein